MGRVGMDRRQVEEPVDVGVDHVELETGDRARSEGAEPFSYELAYFVRPQPGRVHRLGRAQRTLTGKVDVPARARVRVDQDDALRPAGIVTEGERIR